MTKDPVPKKFKKNRGAIESPTDLRDIILGVDVQLIPDPNCPSWEIGFDNEVKYGRLKREHQGSSYSCTGQGTSKYVEMLNLIETKAFTDLSAKFIYSQIFLTWTNGAYIRDAMLIPVNQGVAEENIVPSYDNGKNPTEAFMEDKSLLSPDAFKNAEKYKAKKLVFISVSDPLTENDWENLRQVIWQYGGFVSGYNGHCMYASAYGLIAGKRYIKFVNSYGEGSDQIYYGDVRLYDISALIDLPNPPDKIYMAKLYRDPNNTFEIYALNNGKRSHITNKYSLDQGTLLGNWIYNSGDEIPICPITLWEQTQEIGETVFSPKD